MGYVGSWLACKPRGCTWLPAMAEHGVRVYSNKRFANQACLSKLAAEEIIYA